MAEDTKYIGTSRAAELTGLTSRRIVGLCHEERLAGAVQKGRNWKIPESSVLAYMRDQETAGVHEDMSAYSPEPLLPISVGSTSFTEIAGKSYYVDKTLLIRDLINDSSKVTLFTRPRRFGKTLVIDMLRTFFEKSEEDTAKYFRDKKIRYCGKKYTKLQGTLPVIMLSFKDVKYSSWSDSAEAIRSIFADEFRRHAELFESGTLSEEDRTFISSLMNGTISIVGFSKVLKELTRMLAAHHGSGVVVLIDEYDTPIQQGYTKGFYDEVIAFMRNMLSAGLKDNPYLEFGVLTGIMRVSKENLFSGLNNIKVNTVLDNKYSEYFGFTEAEVREMAEYYGMPEKMGEIRRWYDGYRFGSSEIYNPWSVTNFISNDGNAKPYWANTSDNTIIREIMNSLTPEMADELSRVMQGEEIHTTLNMEVVYPDMAGGAHTILSFLLMTGYLTPTREAAETEFGTFVSLRLPNTEVRRVYNTEILGWLRHKQTGSVITDLERAIFLEDDDMLQKALVSYMTDCISSFDSSAEGFYHGLMLGLAASLSGIYYIRSNRESGEGRFDLQLEPKTKQYPGIIMEFKAAPSGSIILPELAEKALDQIEERRYDTELLSRGVDKIVKYGIAFSGKRASVKVRRTDRK